MIARALAAGTRWQLAAGTVAFLVLRLALTVPRSGPVIVADEVGYLTNARVLAGGVPGQLSTAPFYHGGYSLLLAPLLALDGDPKTSYHLVLAVNAALAASLVPLLYLLLTRGFAVPASQAVWPSLAGAAYPSVTIYTQVAMSENLLLPLFVAWLLCLACLLRADTDGRRFAWAGGAAACAVWLWATHGRMIVVVALTIAAFLGLALIRRSTGRAALLGLAIVAVGIVAVHLLDDFLISRNYGGHAVGEAGRRLSTLDSAGGIVAFARNLVGQSWYLVVAPLGILVAAASPLRWRTRASSSTVLLGVALLAVLGLLVESGLSFRDAERPDMIIYGRYTDVAVPALVALALVRLGDGRRFALRRVLAALALTTIAAVLIRLAIDPVRAANRWNVVGLPAPTFQLGPKVILAAGVAAGVAIAVVAVVQRRVPTAVAPLVLLLFLPTTAVAERNPVLTAQSTFYPSGWKSPAAAVDGAHTVAFDSDLSGGLWVYQWFASNARFVLFSGASGRPPSRFVFSSPEWAAVHTRLHPKTLWVDRSRNRELVRLTVAG